MSNLEKDILELLYNAKNGEYTVFYVSYCPYCNSSLDLLKKNKLVYKAYDISKLKIKSAEANVKAADATFYVIKSKYENGLIDNVAFLESLSEKSDALSQLKTSQNELEIKKANIIYHSGKKLQEYIK